MELEKELQKKKAKKKREEKARQIEEIQKKNALIMK